MTDAFAQIMLESLERGEQRTQEAHDAYIRLRSRKDGKKNRVLTYRCPKGDALAEIYQIPEGILLFHPPYKLSPALNENTSTESGRKANTRDGKNKWNARAYFLDQALNVTLVCDHLEHTVIEIESVQRDIDDGKSNVIIKPA